MNEQQMHQIFLDTDFVHSSGTPEELRACRESVTGKFI